MSQSRFSIVLVGVSALLRRPLVSRLRPADGERSPWVVLAARGCRFDSGFRSAGWPSGSPLPLFGMPRFGVAAGRVRSSAFRFGNCPRRVDSSAGRVGLRAHCFRFSACAASEWPLGEFVLPPSASEIPLGELAFGFTASAFRHAPFRRLPSASWFFRSAGCPSGSLLPLFGTRRFGVAARQVGLRAHCFRFSARTASEWLLGEFVLPSSASEIALGGLAFGFTASAFRHAPLRKLPLGRLVFGLIASAFRHAPLRSGRWASSFFRLPLRKLPSAGWPSDSPLPLFGMRRFGNCPRRVGLRAHRFRFSACTASGLPSASWFFCSAGWPSGSPLPLFGMRRSAPPCRRREGRRSTPTRHLFHFKTLIPTC